MNGFALVLIQREKVNSEKAYWDLLVFNPSMIVTCFSSSLAKSKEEPSA